jgi:NADPH-dependent curcumin reductase CurA
MTRSREILLRRRATGEISHENFELSAVEVPPPAAGEVQVRNQWMSVDPYMRRRMAGETSYLPPFTQGTPLEGAAIGKVTESRDSAFKSGELVSSMFGWREVFNARPEDLRKIDPRGWPAQTFLGIAGMPGLTAYVGLLKVAALRAGDIVFVSAAAGAVGQVACQIAKLKGHTVVGAAGGASKLKYLLELGVDAVIDYKAEADFAGALARAAPDGIDVYFDNVGGTHLEAALQAARPFARFALCGMISEYNSSAPGMVRNLFAATAKDITLRGFLTARHLDSRPDFMRDLESWVAAGKITWKETIEVGLENAPRALMRLFRGENIGKMLVQLN